MATKDKKSGTKRPASKAKREVKVQVEEQGEERAEKEPEPMPPMRERKIEDVDKEKGRRGFALNFIPDTNDENIVGVSLPSLYVFLLDIGLRDIASSMMSGASRAEFAQAKKNLMVAEDVLSERQDSHSVGMAFPLPPEAIRRLRRLKNGETEV